MALEPSERMELLSDMIISKVLQDDLDRSVVTTQLQPEVFSNENFLIYKTIYNFKERGIVPDKEFLLMYLTRNPKLILENTANVEPDLFSDTGDDIVNSFVTATIDKLVRLEKEDHSKENLNLILEKFKIDFKTIYTTRIIDTSKLILMDKHIVGRKTYSGQEDSVKYYQEEMIKLETLISSKSGGGYVDAATSGMDDSSQTKPVVVSDFGNLNFLNEHYGGIKTGYFYNVMAPPKSGKSKFCYRTVHSAKVMYKTNCAFWAREGNKDKVNAELRAIHFDHYYNKLQGNNYVGLSGQDILDDNFPSQEYRDLESISRADFFTNPNYGSLHYIEEDLLIETYIGHLTTVVERYGVKFIAVDYLQLIGSNDKRMSKSERVGQAYQDTLGFIGKYQIAYISPSQFKQEFIKELDKGGDMDTRLGGGESSEIIRTPDVNIALYGTPTDIDNNRLTLLSVPSRVARPFEQRDIFVDLGFCYYADITWE
ncbi:DNA helicase [Bacillus toyonensis]|uniref:DNA helicase n=1 Tax=Bacillus toyonensis TaxID=155322 RepID=UPI0020D284AA|nr:DNA helicase [Bacillus toyonensis]